MAVNNWKRRRQYHLEHRSHSQASVISPQVFDGCRAPRGRHRRPKKGNRWPQLSLAGASLSRGCQLGACLLLWALLWGPEMGAAVAPSIDYSHNMRILKLPKSTQVGELVYRLKGSDGDAQSQLSFGVSGIEARQLLDVVPVPKSWNEADVYLRAPLDSPTGQQQYNLTVFVSDGNKTTSVDSTILVTNDDQWSLANELDEHSGTASLAAEQQHHQASLGEPAGPPNLSPFLRPSKQVFVVPENTQVGEPIGLVSVRESSTSELPVRFELRGKGSERFAIKYVFGPRGQSRGELQLAQPVDYEQQNLYALKVLALNAWTDTRLDTRNVASLDILVAVGDVQDSPPAFSNNSARLLRVANTMQAGALVAKVEALDADFADQRPIGYALDAASPLSAYFDIDKTLGEIRLRRAATELASALQLLPAAQHPGGLSAGHNGLSAAYGALSGEQQRLVVFASELPDTSSYEHLWPPMFARLELPLLLVDQTNEAPQLLGGWQTNGSLRLGGALVLHGFLLEPPASQLDGQPQQQLPVQWFTNLSHWQASLADDSLRQLVLEAARGLPLMLDLNQGPNGTFELSLEGEQAHLFRVEPSYPVSRVAGVHVFVAPGANRSLFDRDLFPAEQTRSFQFELVARDFGPVQRQETRVRCLVELLDANDNAPTFERELYSFQVYESAAEGQLVGAVRAHDADSRGLDTLKYSSLTGKDSQLFHLDQDSGLISVAGPLDREKQAWHLLLAEARDLAGKANYTKVLITVLDANDHAPSFAQSHYDALLLPDGHFETPLVVRALDADEPNSANSQLAYEIIAGNQNEKFAIDSLSGEIYALAVGPSLARRPPSDLQNNNNNNNKVDLPSSLFEPLAPFGRPLDSSGKILPPGGRHTDAHREVEETTQRQPPATPTLKLNWPPRSASERAQRPIGEARLAKRLPQSQAQQASGQRAHSPAHSDSLEDQLPALDLLLNLESEHSPVASGAPDHSQSVATDERQSAAGHHSQSLAATPTSSQPTADKQQQVRSLPETNAATSGHFEALKLPPVTTLVVRAHDFGIPIRSATCKVNIYNLALQSRVLSVILNGTVEQLAERREPIERSFGALTGSRAQIERLEPLSDSSSLTLARVRLAIPIGAHHHQLVDLTDLSGLMQALDYKPAVSGAGDQQQRQSSAAPPPTYIIPLGLPAGPSSNLSGGPNLQAGLYTDSQLNSFALESSALEKRLLIYIIIVAVCILALLVVWMIYSCCHEDKVKVVEKAPRYYARHADSLDSSAGSQGPLKGDARGQRASGQEASTKAKQLAQSAQTSAIGNNLAKQQHQQLLSVDSLQANRPKSDHLSMYNGQVWFESGPRERSIGVPTEPNGSLVIQMDELEPGQQEQEVAQGARGPAGSDGAASEGATGRPPSGNLLAMHKSKRPAASGQFFPNAKGYVENLAAMGEQAQLEARGRQRTSGGGGGNGDDKTSKRSRRRKVAPMGEGVDNQAFESGELAEFGATPEGQQRRARQSSGRHSKHKEGHATASLTSSTRTCSSLASQSGDSSCSSSLSGGRHSGGNRRDSVLLDSDQELLGFDSTGTPIIATHTSVKQPQDSAATATATARLAPSRLPIFKTPAGVTSYMVPLVGDTVMTQEEMVRGQARVGAPKVQQQPAEKTLKRGERAAPADGRQSARVQLEKEQDASERGGPASGRNETQVGPPETSPARTEVEQSAKLEPSAEKLVDLSGVQLVERDKGTEDMKGGSAEIAAGQQQEEEEEEEKRPEVDPNSAQVEGEQALPESEMERGKETGSSEADTHAELRHEGPTHAARDRQPSTGAGGGGGNNLAAIQEVAEGPSVERQRSMDETREMDTQRGKLKLLHQRTMSEDSTVSLKAMQNRELLEKQSIFAMTYSGIATDKLPS